MNFAWTLLGPKDLKQSIHKAARTMDVLTLKHLVNSGAFDLSPFDVDVPGATIEGAQTHRIGLWSLRLREMCAFSRNATLADRHSTWGEEQPKTYQVPVLVVSDDFRAWFAEASVVLVKAWPRVMAQIPASEGPHRGVTELTRWMACACMLDLPEVVRAIHAICPKALTFTLTLSNLFTKNGVGLRFHVRPMQLQVSPVWVAWQFSAGKCLDVFTEVSQKVQPDAMIGKKLRKHLRKILSEPVSLVEAFNRNVFDLVCDNETFQRAIEVGSGSKVFERAVDQEAQTTLLYDKDKPKVGHRIAAYLAQGVYERQPTPTAISATLAGALSVLDGVIEDIELALLDTNTLYLALNAHEPGQDQRDVAVLKLVLQVKEKAGLEAARDLFWHTGPEERTKSLPVTRLFSKNCHKVLVALMDAGVVEPHVARHVRSTPMEIAQSMGSRMVGAMQSWSARRSAQALLDQMDAS